MKIPESTGMRVRMTRSTDSVGEITLQVPNGMWAGWTMDVRLKDEDVAVFLRSIGWRVGLPPVVAHPT